MKHLNYDCLIISGGEFCRVEVVEAEKPFVIACDRGYQYAQRMGITPDMIIGDFDSAPPPESDDIPVERLPVRKDDTDTMHAARIAVDRGFRRIAICCGLGGRFDHSFANIQTATFIAKSGAVCDIIGVETYIRIFSAGQEYRVQLASETFPRREGYSFSVFSLTERCTGVSIAGSSYDCTDIEITQDFPIGEGNSWEADEIEISLKTGIIMIVMGR